MDTSMDKPTTNRSKQTMMMAGVMVAVLAAAATFVLPSALAQGTNSTQSNSNQSGTTTSTIPSIKGSVSIQNATNAFVRDNVKVPFATALSTVQGKASSNERVSGGSLSNVQGYLVYTFKVTNYDAGTYKIVIVDAGNGSILYTSQDMTLQNGGLGCGGHHFGGYGNGLNWGGNQGSSSSSSSTSNSSSSTQATSA
jgi:uncharacterized membrane protein YkoI